MVRRSALLLAISVLLLSPATPFSRAASPAYEITIGGRVLGPRGAPFAEAEVLLLPSLDPVQQARMADAGSAPKAVARALTDARGSFRLSAPRAGLWKVRIQASGFVPLELGLEPLLEPVDLPDAEIAPDFGLTVKVTGRAGRPLPGARVRLAAPETRGPRFQAAAWQPPVRTAIADANGAAILTRSEKEASVLTVSASGHLPQERRNVRGTAVVFKLEPGIEKTLKVLSADKTPAAGVLAVSTDLHHPLGFTDEKGQMSVAVPSRGDLSLTMIADDGRRVEGTVTDKAPRGGHGSGPPSGDGGRPKGGASQAGSAGSRDRTGAQRDTSGARDAAADTPPGAGSKTSAGLEAGGRDVRANASENVATNADADVNADANAGASAAAAPGAKVVRIFTLPERLTVKGRVINARTRGPVAGGLVWVADELWGACVTDAAGSYTLRGPAGRSLEILAGAPGYLKPDPAPFIFAADGRGAPTLALEPGAAIEGIVVDEEGHPLAGAEASLEIKRSGQQMMIVFGREAPKPRAVTSPRGTFRLSPVDTTHNYDLKVTALGFAPSSREILGLEPKRTMSGLRVEMSHGHAAAGRVVDGEGRPIRDAEATLRPARRGRGPGGLGMMEAPGASGSPSFKGTTDGDGLFRITGLAKGSFDLEVRRAGFARKTVQGVEVPERPEPVDLGDLVMEPGLRLHGIVNAPDGLPVEGVEVSFATAPPGPMMMINRPGGQPPVAVTGPDGRFAVEDLRGDEPVSLSFSRSSYVPARESAILLPRDEPLEITMQPTSKVSGQVVGPDKKPVPGAQVTLTRTSSGGIGNEMFKMIMRDSATAGDDGSFVFDNVRPGTISLGAGAPGWQEAKLDGVEVPEGKDVEDIEIPLKTGATITGRVLSPDGRPVIGARIGLVKDEPEPLRLDGVTSDGDGVYRLEGLAPGRVSLEATHDDYVRTVKEIEARAGANKLNLQFEGGQEVSGVVADRSGTPIAGAWVQLSAAGRDWGGPDTTTRQDGTFKLSGIGDGDYSLNAAREGYASSFGDVAVHVEGKPVADLKVLLSSGARITGKVSGVDVEKLPQVDVRARSDNRDASSAVDRQGSYKLENLAPGTWTVTASIAATGQQTRGQVVLEPGAAEGSLDLQFGQGLTLTGRALQGELPVKGAVLFAQGTDVNHSAWGRTGADGSFRMEGLETGTYRIELRQWETGLSYDETVEMASSREVTLKIPVARIVGRIVDGSDRRPIAGATVSLARPGDESRGLMQRGATSDLNGRFEIASVTDGTWTLTTSKTGYAASTAEVSVQAGHDVDDVRVVLDATEGLTLEAKLPSGRVPDTIDVAVLDAAGRSLTAGSYATGENGRVRLSSVPPGTWDVVVSAGGSGVMNVRVTVPGETLTVPLPPACNLKVTVPALAGSTTAATATIKTADGRTFRTLGWMSDATSQWRLAGGRLELDTLPPGSWTVQVAASDGRTWSGTSATQPGSPTELVLR